MEWALDPEALKFALGELPETLAPNELQELLADAELSLFTGAPEVSEELVDASVSSGHQAASRS